MNPYGSRPPRAPQPRPAVYPLAGRFIRLLSTGIDFALLLTLNFSLYGFTTGDGALAVLYSLLPYGLLIIYEIVLGTSPAKQALGLKVHFDFPGIRYRVYRALLKYVFIPFIVYPSMLFTKRRQGLHEKAAKSVVLQPNARGTWLRTTVATLLGAYVMITFGCGQLLNHLTAERYDPELVNLQPSPWIPESSERSAWKTVWLQGGRLEFPDKIQGLPLRGTHLFRFYNTSTGKSLTGPRVVTVLGSIFHPYVDVCGEASSGFLRWTFPCKESPRVVQNVLFETKTEQSLFFDPRSLIRENAKRITKNILFKDGELLFFRSYDSPDHSVFWYALARFNENGQLDTVTDHIHVAGDGMDHYFGASIIWQDLERQEAIVSSLIDSFRFDPGNHEIADRLLESGRATQSVNDLLSAIELAEDKLPAAEALYEVYARTPYGFEQRLFADWVGDHVGEDLRFMDLNEKVWDWHVDEEEGKR